MKPILFNTEMIRAILDGRKSVTRRVVPERILDKYNEYDDLCNAVMPQAVYGARDFEREFFIKNAPYRAGDILYVRETWQYVYDLDGNEQILEETGRYVYAADGYNLYNIWVNSDGTHKDHMPWHPSIHMPKEAARIFLRVTDVYVEWLQDITEYQAKAEGFNSRKDFIDTFFKMYPECGEESWLWVIGFERISKEEAYEKNSSI